MEYQTNNQILKYENWIFLLKELYQNNVEKYNPKKVNQYKQPYKL
jgi:hypothetical protein